MGEQGTALSFVSPGQRDSSSLTSSCLLPRNSVPSSDSRWLSTKEVFQEDDSDLFVKFCGSLFSIEDNLDIFGINIQLVSQLDKKSAISFSFK